VKEVWGNDNEWYKKHGVDTSDMRRKEHLLSSLSIFQSLHLEIERLLLGEHLLECRSLLKSIQELKRLSLIEILFLILFDLLRRRAIVIGLRRGRVVAWAILLLIFELIIFELVILFFLAVSGRGRRARRARRRGLRHGGRRRAVSGRGRRRARVNDRGARGSSSGDCRVSTRRCGRRRRRRRRRGSGARAGFAIGRFGIVGRALVAILAVAVTADGAEVLRKEAKRRE
jgi:hypothetical protein